MAKALQFQIVERVRALIADQEHWCRGELARDVIEGVCPTSASAVRRCALGVVVAAAHELTHDLGAAHDFAFNALRPRHRHLVRVNDMRGHAVVLSLFDEVIAMNVRQTTPQQ
jgi:hypothetical protein